MDYSLLISILALIISVVSLFIAHRLNRKRDFENKKRQIRIEYLINAWRELENASNRKDSKLNVNLEKAIADIQLFGTEKQVQLAKDFVMEWTKKGSVSTIPLLKDLRNDLRKELLLDDSTTSSDEIIILRVQTPQ